jgi:hypothetical protein
MAGAPLDDEPLTEEDERAIEEAAAETDRGYSLDEIRAMLRERRQGQR